MTESFRRSGEYENPYQGDQQQHSGYAEGETQQQPAYLQQQPASAPVNPEWPPPPAYDPASAPPAPAAPSAEYAYATYEQPAAAASAPTALLTEPVSSAAGSAPSTRRRARGPIALLAAVAFVAAAIGGGTAYGIQELTGTDTVASSSTSTSVVPTSQKGTVSGVATAVSPSIVEISATSNAGESTGSGVIITSDGEIITNNHVISGASQIKVTTSNGKSYTAEVVGTDSKKDLALIKLRNASGLKAATLGDSAGVKVGDQVVAIGSPEGLTGTVTSGIVSALDRDVTVSTDESQGQQQQQQDGGSGQWPFEFGGRQFNGDTGSSTTTYKALQTDASLNPGNSGGALIDMNGNIIGINSAMYSAADASSAGAGSVGLGFAIPVNTVKADLSTLRAGGSD
ncbi:trypsin-like peptidase domain-containing protein [Streptomyces europaeiscabiei]|uniref:Trypsin-like peptidase domain-containing protein n=1 Tax=Streptomyces europaeiscabiei TaxID=146819 RepID=A0ABU4NHF7_9ACTN|nr:trypsin-like peptidase domain-containing protein [Streptomyces europaeiscabiei]MDX3544736.1 trypsin-like peptidase domain-containing protein [Streptomyces europaeiscabiei]MDX3554086.1 trypsin-like peptidase domain-containing protein [Streptomyces europaeiscabiei]MDX3670958.1 trypsin-like peptidase domain-containing protein [Streptomyces europaeiscabiei]MDX3702204.1 trypsin-like peptidase domain-containing protein [Streptomyces europaeiscabiei]